MNPVFFLPHLVRTSAQAGVLVLIILLAQQLFRRHLSPRWRYSLWLLLILRLALPWSPPSPTSLFNLLPAPAASVPSSLSEFPMMTPRLEPPAPATGAIISPADLTAPSALPVPPAEVPIPTAAESSPLQTETIPPSAFLSSRVPAPARAIPATRHSLSWLKVAAGIWLAGVIGLAVLLAISTLRLNRRLRRSRPLEDDDAHAILEQCRQKLGLTALPALVESDAVSSPALYGVFRPRLLLPPGFTANFSPAQLRLVFCHELAHLRRRDLPLNWLVAALQAIHWFNPLVWFGFSRWRADRELACDAIVLEAVGADQSQEYGATILRLLETFTRRTPLPGFVGILEDKTRLRRRLEMIAQFRPSARWPVGSLALLAGIAALCLTDARSVVPAVAPLPDVRSISTTSRRFSPPAPEPGSALPATPGVSPASSVVGSSDEAPASLAVTTPVRISGPMVSADAVSDAVLPLSAAAGNPAPESSKLASLEPSAAPPPVVAAPASPEPAPIRAEARTPEPVRPAPPSPPAPTLTLFVVGDSLAADLREPGDGWGNALIRYFNPAQAGVRNASRAGVSSRTYRTLGDWDRVLAQVHTGDVVLLQFNENEAQPLTSPTSIGTLPGAGEETREIVQADGRREIVHTQGWYLRSYLQEVRSKGATPLLATSTLRNAWNSYERVGRTRWQETPAESGSAEDKVTLAVAQEQKVPVVDLARLAYLHYRLIGREAVGRLFEPENDHLNRYGADLNAYLLVSALKGVPEVPLRGIWSAAGALVIPASAKVNVPVRTEWRDISTSDLPGAYGPPGSEWVQTIVTPGPDSTSLYGDGWLSEGSVQPANDKLPTIFMIGDEAVRGGRGIGAGNQWGWGDLVAAYLDQAKVNLMVTGGYGLSSRSFLTSGRWQALRHWIQRRDIVLIEFGHYESTPVDDPTGRGTLPGVGSETAETTRFPRGMDFDDRNVRHGRETVYTYGGYLRTYVTEVKKDGALPILISPTPRNRWQDGKIVRDPELVRETAQVAKEAGVPFFDLNSLLADQYDAMGQPAAERLFTDPAFVTNSAGAGLAAESIVKLLLAQNPARIQNFLNPAVAVSFNGEPLKPATPDNSGSFGQAMAGYRAIDKGMSRADVVARLGMPDRSSRSVSIYWKQGAVGQHYTEYVELVVRYDQQDRVVDARFHRGADRYTDLHDE